MSDFNYVDIFATKGIEYIIVITFLISIVSFWSYLNSPGKSVMRPVISGFKSALDRIAASIPKGVFLDPTHSWAYLEPTGSAQVGVDGFLLSATGPVNYISVKRSGETINRGEVMGTLEQDGRNLSVYAPITGKITSANLKRLSPYQMPTGSHNQGWLYSVEPENWVRDIKSLMLARQAQDWIRKEYDRLKDFFAFSTEKYGLNSGLVTLQDGGELVDEALSHMPADIWIEFQSVFIDANKTG